MSDLVERLQKTSWDVAVCFPQSTVDACHEAATRIEQLEAENARLREALQPFAECAESHEWLVQKCRAKGATRDPDQEDFGSTDDYRRARAALAGKVGT